MGNKYFIDMILLLIMLVFACAPKENSRNPDNNSPEAKEKQIEKNVVVDEPQKNPTLKIMSPDDGEVIKGPTVTVKLKAENFKLVPVGSLVKDGEGHFHVWLDNDKKIGPQTIFIFDNAVPGKHEVVAELVKSDHSSLTPKVSKPINIEVESVVFPNIEEPQQQESVSEFTIEADDKDFYPNRLKARIGDKVVIHFKFRDDSIYYAGLDIKGPFPDIKYRLKGEQPLTVEFTMKDETKINSWWPASGVKKADLIVEVEK